MSVRECVRCSANKSDGARCTRRTCEYPEMCWQHFQKEHHLKIAKSGIRDADKGLFTMQNIKPNTRIVEYTGEIKHEPDTRGPYVVEVTRDKFVDARSTQSKIGRYANMCRAVNTRAKDCRFNNANLSEHRGRVWLKSKQHIPAGSEIFVSYGRSYFR